MWGSTLDFARPREMPPEGAPVKGFLADTNVVSEARKGRRADQHCVAWIAANRDDLYLSVLVTGEIRRGIESVRRRDAPAAGARSSGGCGESKRSFEERILPVDAAVADRWGHLMAKRSLARDRWPPGSDRARARAHARDPQRARRGAVRRLGDQSLRGRRDARS